jgi:hypothetical protein
MWNFRTGGPEGKPLKRLEGQRLQRYNPLKRGVNERGQRGWVAMGIESIRGLVNMTVVSEKGELGKKPLKRLKEPIRMRYIPLKWGVNESGTGKSLGFQGMAIEKMRRFVQRATDGRVVWRKRANYSNQADGLAKYPRLWRAYPRARIAEDPLSLTPTFRWVLVGPVCINRFNGFMYRTNYRS